MRLLGLIIYCFSFFWILTAIAAERHLAFKHNGIPVALDGHSCACGCALISSLPEAEAS
ncbi:PAAR domain-containing protein [Pseudomonas sp. Pseusp16]|uniref:PAAR domain-containing protein n=1 Tax=Pseudomonas sp. Pseusp16 TaxID=3243021 RepID=UPI0039B51B6B